MNGLFLFVFCGLGVLALTLLLMSAVCLGKVKENRRRNQLGKLLALSGLRASLITSLVLAGLLQKQLLLQRLQEQEQEGLE